jgi:serine/threonine protein phosphatase 1
MNRTLVIGDIHGGLKALKQVFERASVNYADTLVFLGDYVDGWSESAQTIDHIIELDNQQTCIFIKGNHDAWCQEWLRTNKANSTWLIHGGQETVDSYARYDDTTRQAHLNFFERMRMYYVDEQNRLFIHAGFTSMHGPEKEFHGSNYTWDRTLWEVALSMDTNIKKDDILYPKRLKLFYEIYIGHTPTLYIKRTEPVQSANIWNMDTGAAFNGKLSVMDIETREFWQSDMLPQLYPTEKGRNKLSP